MQGPGSKAATTQTPVEDEVKDSIPARWRRKGTAAKHHQGSEQVAFLAGLKAHFEEVDAFELAVETPTPPPRNIESRIWRDDSKPRPMSLGLSRRSSTLTHSRLSNQSLSKASPSPLRISMGQKKSLQSLPEHKPVEPDTVLPGRVSQSWARRRTGSLVYNPAAPARRSSAGTAGQSSGSHMIHRVSMGINDALQWLTRRGSLPGSVAEEADELETPSGINSGKVFDGEDVSRLAEPEDAGIFTIEEEGEESPLANNTGSARKNTVLTPADATARDIAGAAVATLNEEFAIKLALESRQSYDTKAKDEVPPATPAALSPAFSELEPLEQLLKLCGQTIDVASLPNMNELLGRHVNLNKVKKIGEGTFGEAFKAGNVVLKIVPMEGSVPVNGEPQKKADEILAEVAVTLTLSGLRDNGRNKDNVAVDGEAGQEKYNVVESADRRANVTDGFVETYGVGICRGTYAEALRKEWHSWDKSNGSENDPVDIFQENQLFVVFVVADGGIDLEHFVPRSFEEVRSILMQVCMTLAIAEEACEFEHRDLHWGNLLISRDGTESVPYRLRDVDIAVHTAGVKVTLIDFTLSRVVTAEGEIAHCDLESDPEIFNGPKGDVQAETYRRMRKIVNKEWARHVPATNTLWLHYLADIMMSHKMPTGCGREEKGLLRAFRKDAIGAAGAVDVVWHELFTGCWTSGAT